MREYLIRSGKHAGTHLIFENQKDCEEFFKVTTIIIHKWAIDDVRKYKVGDWVKAEDGYVVEILAIRKLKQKNRKKGYSIFIRFPMGTFACYVRVDNTIKYPRFYAQFTQGDKNSASGKSRMNFSNRREEAKNLYANYLSSGLYITEAYKLAFGFFNVVTDSQLHLKARKMLADEIVSKELARLMAPRKEKINDTVSDNTLVDEIKNLLDSSVKGSAEHRRNIEFILKLKGYLPKRD